MTLKAIMAEIEAGVKGGVEGELTLQAIQNITEFRLTYRQTMAHTPGKALLDAAPSRHDHITSLIMTGNIMEQFGVPGSVESNEYVDAADMPLADFEHVDNVLKGIRDHLEVEEGVGKLATGLHDALTNH